MKDTSIFRTADLPKVGEIFFIRWLIDDKPKWYLAKRGEDVVGHDNSVMVVLDFMNGDSYRYRTKQLVGDRVQYRFSKDLNTDFTDDFN